MGDSVFTKPFTSTPWRFRSARTHQSKSNNKNLTDSDNECYEEN